MMARLSTSDYDALERAVSLRTRLSILRRGTEYIVIPERLFMRDGREAIEAVHPTTGDHITLMLDEIDSFEVVR